MRTAHGVAAITRRAFALFCVLVLTVAWLSLPVRAAAPDPADVVQIFARDVYFINGSTLRNPDETTDPSKPLFNIAGVNLNVTWGEWQNAQATSTVQVHKGPKTEIKMQFSGLIPGGLYSVFYGTITPDSNNPLCPNVERTLALSAAKANPQGPDASSFIADADGTATYRAEVNEDLLAPLQTFFSIIYHADGGSYHPLPNKGEFQTQGEAECRSSYGEDAMRQLIIFQKFQ